MKKNRFRKETVPRYEPSIWIGSRATTDASAEIKSIVLLINKNVKIIFIWVLGFMTCGAIYTKMIQREYIATTQILLQPRVIVNDGPEDLRHFHQFMIDSEQCETELRVLRSEQLIYRVFDALKVAQTDELRNGADGFWSYLAGKIDLIEQGATPNTETQRAFNAFNNRIRARRLGLSYVIEISYRSRKASQAVSIVNSIASAYAVYKLRGAIAREQVQGAYGEGRSAALQKQMFAANAGMRTGTIPAENMLDAEVRLLGASSMPLNSIYPKMAPILALMALFGSVSGLLILVIASKVSIR